MSVQAPLPERIRPDTLEDFLGQAQLKTRLAAILASDHLPSLLFFGPPGCGKSTLALLLAKHSGKPFVRISAPETGLQNLRRRLNGVDILILDELHRFTKAQQDFFLPLIESGELVLLATTTENPSFSVTRQLLSRLHVLRLHPLGLDELLPLARRGAVALEKHIGDDALEVLCLAAHGDARTLLNLLEYTAGIQEEITPERIRLLLPEMLMRHDKNGDSHYEYISALIKSVRGSDADAALYYLACLLEGGEDPRFICRRLILSAAEDIGLADPSALPLAVSCQQAVEFVGMPEGYLPMAETVTYLALAPKSNSTYSAYARAAKYIRQNGPSPVPLHLRNATTALQREWGYGQGYKYPHNVPESWVKQQYLPEDIPGHFYQPKENGAESRLYTQWRNRTRQGRTPERAQPRPGQSQENPSNVREVRREY
ncbi:MAG: replication-associated recombination protein A [Desulfovibrio sp.]|nr:replication-associated recombination protein A [Desulfovibrio sp.]